MSDTPDLASLTIKDLRLMAGEHSIQNASRMGKEKLIGVLQGVIAARSGQGETLAVAAAGAGTTETTVVVANVPAAAEPEVISPESVAPLAGHDANNDEPEVLDAAEVSALTDPTPSAAQDGEPVAGEGQAGEGPGEGERRRRRRRRRRGRGRGREDDGSGQQGNPAGEGAEGSDEEGDDDGDDAEAAAPAPQNAERPAAPAHASTDADAAPAAVDGQAAPVTRQPFADRNQRRNHADRPAQPERAQGERQAHDRYGDRQQGERQQGERAAGDRQERQSGDRQQGDRQPNDRQGDRAPRDGNRPAGERQAERQNDRQGERPQVDRSPRPRLDGPQRPVSSVLDRLSVFTRGILELCDPSTPSWAQPRLAELLAEAGVVPMPGVGQPHADYHLIVGTIATSAVPAGHICEISSQGFALRGDRGDLFCLRKASVKIAGTKTDNNPVQIVARPAPAAPAPIPAPVAVAEEAPVARQDTQAPASEALAADVAVNAPTDAAAPVVTADGELPPSVYQERAPRERRERGPRDRRERDRRERTDDALPGDAPAADATPAPVLAASDEPEELSAPASETASEATSEAAPSPVLHTPRPPVPSPGRSPESTHPRESAVTAQPLPLTHLATDELAAKPKAEGFRALGLNDQILADLAEMGWKDPSPIQTAAIPVALSGKDMIGQAQTGTGKTAGFVLPTLQKLYALEGDGPVALMMCPTRELAKQVYNEFIKMAGTSAARAALIYGGVDMNDQYRALARKPHVVIGTPGRVIDHMKRKTLDLSRLATIVLDEADQMLDIGFWPDVTYIMSHTPPQRQVLLFSATFPEQVKELAEKHMKDPERIQIAPEQVTVSNVDQKYIAVPRERKNELLARFIETFNPPQLVVFCKTKHQTDRVAEVLKRKNMSAGAIHGDLPQSKREKTLQAFRSGELQSLVATNVAARGLDIPSVSHVVNYDVPETPEEYVHRIGRTARNGASGVARTFITSEDGQFLLEIEKHIGLLLEEEQVEGFTVAMPTQQSVRTIADAPVGTPRLLKPLIGGIRLGRRR